MHLMTEMRTAKEQLATKVNFICINEAILNREKIFRVNQLKSLDNLIFLNCDFLMASKFLLFNFRKLKLFNLS